MIATDTTPLVFTIPGKPRPWKRAGRNGGRTYDPNADAKTEIAKCAVLAMRECGFKFIEKDEAAYCNMNFYLRRPRGCPDQIYHTTRPDADNLEKLVMDALNHVVWDDDCLVSKPAPVKYCEDKDKLRTEIEIGRLENKRHEQN